MTMQEAARAGCTRLGVLSAQLTAIEDEVEAPGHQQQDEQRVAQRVRVGLLQRLVRHRAARQRPLEPEHPLRHKPCSSSSRPPVWSGSVEMLSRGSKGHSTQKCRDAAAQR